MKSEKMAAGIKSGMFDRELRQVYVTDGEIDKQKIRYMETIKSFERVFGSDRDISVCSAPGRTEVCGNHTDHNHGCVLAASINLDAIGVVSKNNENTVRVKSKGYDMDVVHLDELTPDVNEYGHSSALLRGVLARLKELGYEFGGFDAYTTSDVLSGSGLSSSAAYEVLLGTIISHLFNDGKIDAVTIAQVAQYAENKFFGKPCGLMDQMASSVGSFVTIDFADVDKPIIEKVEFDFASCNHSLCIVDTGGSHSDLTDDYAAVRSEMEQIAREMGKTVLAEVDYDAFMKQIPVLRQTVNDRAILRAIHFFNENRRVKTAVKALNGKDFAAFKTVVLSSGRSSYMYNQNVFTPKNVAEQGVSLALAVTEELLSGKGAFRVHGGGFAGTVQAFVPNELLDSYKQSMEAIFGQGTCYVLAIRPVGGVQVMK